MELEFSSSVLVTLSLLTIFMMLALSKRYKNNGRTTSLPPGPWKLPIIGNLHHLVGSLPHHRLRDLANKYGPLMHLQLGELPTVVVSSAEFAKEVMKTHDLIFASRPYNRTLNIVTYNYTDVALSPYGEYWRQLRKICVLEVLSIRQVQSFQSIREEEVSDLINWIDSRAGTSINLSDKISSVTSSVTSRAAFGKKCKDQETFLSILEDYLKLSSGFNIADFFPSFEGFLLWIGGVKSRVEKIHQEADRILENIINERKKDNATLELHNNEKSSEDLVDVLLKVQDAADDNDAEFRLTQENIKAVIWDVFTAGTETSATTLDWAISELMKNPKVMEKAQTEVREVFNRIGKINETGINEMKFLKLVVKETLRLHPPLPLILPRECGERCTTRIYIISNKKYGH